MNPRTVVMSLAALLATAQVASAASTPDWQFEVTPYAWATGLEGDARVNSTQVDFNKKFGDIVEKVDMAGSMLAIAQKGRLLMFAQADYFDLSSSKIQITGAPAGGKFESKITVGEFAVGMQVDGWAPKQTFDLLIGMRYTRVDNALTIDQVGTFSKTTNLKDPMLLVRPSLPIFPSRIDGLRFNPMLGIGGGGDSKLVYEMQPEIQYQFTDHVAGRFGYRRLGYKFNGQNNSENELNLMMGGLLVGLGVTW